MRVVGVTKKKVVAEFTVMTSSVLAYQPRLSTLLLRFGFLAVRIAFPDGLSTLLPLACRPTLALFHVLVILFPVQAALFKVFGGESRTFTDLGGQANGDARRLDLPGPVVAELVPPDVGKLAHHLQHFDVTRQASLGHLAADFAAAGRGGLEGFLPGLSLLLLVVVAVTLPWILHRQVVRIDLGLGSPRSQDGRVHCNPQQTRGNDHHPHQALHSGVEILSCGVKCTVHGRQGMPRYRPPSRPS